MAIKQRAGQLGTAGPDQTAQVNLMQRVGAYEPGARCGLDQLPGVVHGVVEQGGVAERASAARAVSQV